MNCRDFIEFLWRYDSGELPPSERSQFESHLAICPQCVAYLQNYRTTVMLGREALAVPSDAPVPEEVPEDLVKAILAARK